MRYTLVLVISLIITACAGTPSPNFEATLQAGIAATQTAQPTPTPTSTSTTIPSPPLPSASPTVASTSGVDCAQTTTTQREMTECARSRAVKAAESLNQLLGELADVLPPSQWSELTKLQEQWDQLTQTHCQWEASFHEGGSLEPKFFPRLRLEKMANDGSDSPFAIRKRDR